MLVVVLKAEDVTIYQPSLTHLTLNQTMDQYINGKVNASNTLKILELNVESLHCRFMICPMRQMRQTRLCRRSEGQGSGN